MQKERYVFVAHGGADAQVAGKVTYYLRERGLRVWYDAWNTYAHLNYDGFVQELQGTRFLLPVFSPSAMADSGIDLATWIEWLQRVEAGGILVVPVLCDKEILDALPSAFRDKKMVRVGMTFESDLNELIFATALDDHVQQAKKRERLVAPSAPVQEFVNDCHQDLVAEQWPSDLAYQEVLITPSRTIKERPLESLVPTIMNCPVKISGWSGAPFPFPLPLGPSTITKKKAVVFLDKHAWIGEDFSFYYWQFNANGFFLQRNHLHEDHCMGRKGEFMSPDWLVLWVTKVLRFSHKLLVHLQDCNEVGVELRLHGMNGRALLWSPASGVTGTYKCTADDIVVHLRLGMKTELVGAALEVIQYVLSRFGLSRPLADGIKRSTTMLCDGRYYRLEV